MRIRSCFKSQAGGRAGCHWIFSFRCERWGASFLPASLLTGVLLLGSAAVCSANNIPHPGSPAADVSPASAGSAPAPIYAAEKKLVAAGHRGEETPAPIEKLFHAGTNSVTDTPPALSLRDSQALLPGSNLKPAAPVKGPATPNYQAILEEGSKLKHENSVQAEKIFIRLLQSPAPKEVQKNAMLELAVIAHEKPDLVKAQQIYAQFLKEYPGDPAAPEVLLRQGLIYRHMGAPTLALSKFYSVMSSALNLKADRLAYYQRLVLLAQSEIAETYYLQGRYDEASEFFSRLLKLDSPELDKAKIHYKQVRSLSLRNRSGEVAASAGLFLERYPEAESTPEVRYLLAEALKKLGRNHEAMEQVRLLLVSEKRVADRDPTAWTYWRQKTGNEIANQLYQEGDYFNALQVYQSLASLNGSPDWQLPALYQVGLVYERLRQTQKATETYDQIIQQQSKLGTNRSNPSLMAVLDMAKWRKDFLVWQEKADESSRKLNGAEPTPENQ